MGRFKGFVSGDLTRGQHYFDHNDDGRFVLTRLNRDDNSGSYDYRGSKLSPKRIAQKLHTQSVPAIVFLNSEGKYISHVTGFIKARRLTSILQ